MALLTSKFLGSSPVSQLVIQSLLVTGSWGLWPNPKGDPWWPWWPWDVGWGWVRKLVTSKLLERSGETPISGPFLAAVWQASLHHRCSHHAVPCRPQGEGAADYVLALPGQRANINILRTVSLCSPGWLWPQILLCPKYRRLKACATIPALNFPFKRIKVVFLRSFVKMAEKLTQWE